MIDTRVIGGDPVGEVGLAISATAPAMIGESTAGSNTLLMTPANFTASDAGGDDETAE